MGVSEVNNADGTKAAKNNVNIHDTMKREKVWCNEIEPNVRKKVG